MLIVFLSLDDEVLQKNILVSSASKTNSMYNRNHLIKHCPEFVLAVS